MNQIIYDLVDKKHREGLERIHRGLYSHNAVNFEGSSKKTLADKVWYGKHLCSEIPNLLEKTEKLFKIMEKCGKVNFDPKKVGELLEVME